MILAINASIQKMVRRGSNPEIPIYLVIKSKLGKRRNQVLMDIFCIYYLLMNITIAECSLLKYNYSIPGDFCNSDRDSLLPYADQSSCTPFHRERTDISRFSTVCITVWGEVA